MPTRHAADKWLHVDLSHNSTGPGTAIMVSELMRRLGDAAAGLVRQGLYGEMWGEPLASSGPSLMASGPSALLRSRTTDNLVSRATPGTTPVHPHDLPMLLLPPTRCLWLAQRARSVPGLRHHALATGAPELVIYPRTLLPPVP